MRVLFALSGLLPIHSFGPFSHPFPLPIFSIPRSRLFTFYKVHRCVPFQVLLFYFLLYLTLSGVGFFYEKFIATLQNVFFSLWGSIWVDDGKAVDNEMWVDCLARTADTFPCSASCMDLHYEKKQEQNGEREVEEKGRERGDTWRGRRAECLKLIFVIAAAGGQKLSV